jgi:hypothetical protein
MRSGSMRLLELQVAYVKPKAPTTLLTGEVEKLP